MKKSPCKTYYVKIYSTKITIHLSTLFTYQYSFTYVNVTWLSFTFYLRFAQCYNMFYNLKCLLCKKTLIWENFIKYNIHSSIFVSTKETGVTQSSLEILLHLYSTSNFTKRFLFLYVHTMLSSAASLRIFLVIHLIISL